MRLIGTVSPEPKQDGSYVLYSREREIPLRHLYPWYAGKRVAIFGMPMWSKELGSYFKVFACKRSTLADANDVVIAGKIVGIMPEIKNSRNRRSACLLVEQENKKNATVLITALASKVDELDIRHLSQGDFIRISGYITSNKKGLHVIYQHTLKEVVPDV